MRPVEAIREPEPARLLDALLEAAPGPVLLLGPGQALKPGAQGALDALAAGGGLAWVRACPHPDLALDAYGSWLVATGRPPFGKGRREESQAWGLLGPAQDLAAALARAIADTPPGGDWQPALVRELERRHGSPALCTEAWVFQAALPSLAQALDAERRRARTLAALDAGSPAGSAAAAAPPPAADPAVPEDWRSLALALAAVPTATLDGTVVSGLPAAGLVAALASAAMARCFELARGEGLQAVRRPPAVARPLRRVAVVHPAYGGSLNLARRSAEALERLGYEVTRVDPSGRAAELAEAQRQGPSEALFRSLERDCLDAVLASRPQLLWVLAQAPLSAGALRSLRRSGVATAFWFCEDHRVRPTWKSVAPVVDAFFPMQGGPLQGALRALGVAPMPVLAACAASDACRVRSPSDERRALGFFGAPYANRLALFEALADLPLELFGEGWSERATPSLRGLVRDGSRLDEAQGFELFRTTGINLNLHSSPSLHGIDPDGDYVNPRTFEIAACGGFQLCDRRRDLGAAFEEGAEIEAFSSLAELRAKLERWAGDGQGRRRMADAARLRVAREHTYEHRLAAALAALGVRSGGAVGAGLGASIP